MYMSKVLNLKIHDKDARPYLLRGCHRRKGNLGQSWKAAICIIGWHTFNIMKCKFVYLQFLCGRFYLRCLSFRGFQMQMHAHFCPCIWFCLGIGRSLNAYACTLVICVEYTI